MDSIIPKFWYWYGIFTYRKLRYSIRYVMKISVYHTESPHSCEPMIQDFHMNLNSVLPIT